MRMSRPSLRWTVTALLALRLLAVPAYAAVAPVARDAESPCDLDYEAGRLSAHVLGAPLGLVLNRLSSLTGLKVLTLSNGLDELVSVRFARLPLGEAVARLLAHRSYVLTIAHTVDDPSTGRLWILSRAENPPVRPVTTWSIVAPLAPVAGEPLLPLGTEAMPSEPLVVPVLGLRDRAGIFEVKRLAERGARDARAKLDSLLAGDSGPAVRAEALDALARRGELSGATLRSAALHGDEPMLRQRALEWLRAQAFTDEGARDTLAMVAEGEPQTALGVMAQEALRVAQPAQ